MTIIGFFDKILGNNKKKITARTPFNLQIHDIVEYDLVEYQVIGKITYREDGYVWYDYHLFDSQNHLWLYAEDDDVVKLGLYNRLAADHPLYATFQQRRPKTIQYEGKTYSLVEAGEAEIMVEGKVGAKDNQRVKYWDYETGNGDQLSVEKWGSELEISAGQDVKESLLEFYPAS